MASLPLESCLPHPSRLLLHPEERRVKTVQKTKSTAKRRPDDPKEEQHHFRLRKVCVWRWILWVFLRDPNANKAAKTVSSEFGSSLPEEIA
jgi:hypothetical protein